ncbi:uncharacterized, partial [Tachysurus ichikawai]
ELKWYLFAQVLVGDYDDVGGISDRCRGSTDVGEDDLSNQDMSGV